jgi:dynactin complex subunit
MNGGLTNPLIRSTNMAAWYKHSLFSRNTTKFTPKDYEDMDYEDEGDEMSFEDQVLEKLASIAKTLEKLEKRLETLETRENTRIDRLEFDLRRKDDYVYELLAKLLDKDFVTAPGKPSSGTAVSKYTQQPPSNGKGLGPGAKLP